LEAKTPITSGEESALESYNSSDLDIQYEHISSSEGIMLRNKCLIAEILVG
jgi:hypothetical protein